jgi:sulfhydrogenase subunit beta (sulfur reductase)
MKYITQNELSKLITDLAHEATLIAPRNIDGVLLYRPIQDYQDIVWHFNRPVLSVKEALFPATDQLLRIEKTGQEIVLSDALPEGKQVIFGVRPCDARGLKILDALFLDTPPRDINYASRRADTTIIGLACQEMHETCFCTSVGGYPDDPQDVDAMLTEVDDGYLVQIVTEKGQALFGERVKPVVGPMVVPSLVSRPTPTIPPPDAIDWPSRFNDDYWDHLAERCLSCRICGYVCPTCRCFIVRDEATTSSNGHKSFERIRCWDTCTSEAYRRIAGGHNPRAAKGQRLRNRFFCKFHYYPQQYGPMACTGCGRCIEMCPVNIDIGEVLQDLAEVVP